MADSFAPSKGLAKLVQTISDYVGYENPDIRCSTDKTIRRLVIQNIIDLLKLFDEKHKAASDQQMTDFKKQIDRTRRRLKVLCGSLESPTYLHGQFFLAGDVNARRLERIYELETDMLEETGNINEEILSFQPSMSKETIEDHFLRIGNFVDNLNQSLFEREALIIGEA